MSRRESRVSISVRQNDALLEFENFKKKFLLANKHITKLNSTLSVRIEELNAQISTLYVENLRLRASEIALAAQLKREREKSRIVVADAEAATLNLTKHLGSLRKTFNIAPGQASSPSEPPQSRARKPVANPTLSSPATTRLARAPNVPGIYEDEEVELCSSAGADEDQPRDDSPSPTLRRKTKARLSASRLPLPSRVSSPPPLPTPSVVPLHIDLAESTSRPKSSSGKRKSSRRQSGLITIGGSGGGEVDGLPPPPRPASPAFGSPIRREAGLAEQEDELADATDRGAEVEVDKEDRNEVDRRVKQGKTKEREADKDRDSGTDSGRAKDRERERKRARDREREREREAEGEEQQVQAAEREEMSKPLRLKDVTNSPRSRADLPALETSAPDHADRQQTQTPSTEPPTSAISTWSSSSRPFLSTAATTPAPPTPLTPYLPTPRPSSSPTPEEDAPPTTINGRESRRTRKSVNYAEPKLNTKMRKPDPPPGTTSTKKRSSAAAQLSDDPGTRSSLEVPPPSMQLPQSLAITIPLPPSSSSSSSSPHPSGATTVKRKKSRPYVLPPEEGDESEGAQADAEFNGLSGGRSHGWVNVDGRRRSVLHAAGAGLGVGASTIRRVEGDDGRRHSMAV